MPQALPNLPQLPGLDGRTTDARPRPADASRRSEHREMFDRLLDRFSRPDAANDARQESARETAADEPAEPVRDSANEDVADADGEPAEKHAAPPTEKAADATTVALEVVPVVPANVTVVQVQAEPVATTAVPVIQPETAATLATQSAAAAAADLESTGRAMDAAAAMTPAAPAAAPSDEASPQFAAVAELAAARPVKTATATPVGSTATDKKPTLANLAASLEQMPVAEPSAEPKFDPDALSLQNEQAADAAQQRQDIKARNISAHGMAQTPALLTTPEEPAALGGRSDQPVAAFAVDTPRSAAALYHKIAEAARPAGDAPAPAEQLSMRLLHAVADGKRAIQVHLHPAELGSIDVKMQWQGDRLTAQFTVDRPETLQLLQRDLPTLERSLSQAGVNVDSGSLQFSLRQQQDQSRSGGGQGFAPARGAAIERMDARGGDEPLGQIVREGLLSIRV